MKRLVNINGEVVPLTKVLVHRPGNEILNITPNNYQKLLFRNIPLLEKIQKEHDAYVNKLRKEGIDVIYLIDLVLECLNANPNIKEKFIKQFIKESGIKNEFVYNQIYHLLTSIKDNRSLVCKCIEGIRKNEITIDNKFYDYELSCEMIIEPMSNLYFIGNLISCIGSGVSINKMSSFNENRSGIFFDYIFKYHPKYKNTIVYNNRYDDNIDGGDILVLNDEVLCVGVSGYTTTLGISNLAKNVLNNGRFKYVVAIDLKDKNMTLDKYLSMVSDDTFLMYHEGFVNSKIYELTLYNGELVINEVHMAIDKVLEKYLRLDKVNLISYENIDVLDVNKEQWMCAFNTLCIKSMVVLAYKQNNLINNQLRNHNIKVIEVEGNNILNGAQGIRSLVVPLIREK